MLATILNAFQVADIRKKIATASMAKANVSSGPYIVPGGEAARSHKRHLAANAARKARRCRKVRLR